MTKSSIVAKGEMGLKFVMVPCISKGLLSAGWWNKGRTFFFLLLLKMSIKGLRHVARIRLHLSFPLSALSWVTVQGHLATIRSLRTRVK